MQRVVPVGTSLGSFHGRDCIFLHRVTFEDHMNTLRLEGEINGKVCAMRPE
jgi:hypothetical protein